MPNLAQGCAKRYPGQPRYSGPGLSAIPALIVVRADAVMTVVVTAIVLVSPAVLVLGRSAAVIVVMPMLASGEHPSHKDR